MLACFHKSMDCLYILIVERGSVSTGQDAWNAIYIQSTPKEVNGNVKAEARGPGKRLVKLYKSDPGTSTTSARKDLKSLWSGDINNFPGLDDNGIIRR